jgi:DNA-binding NarL/FixJ family response regulator
MQATKKIRCVLVHDHVLLRQGLRRLLEDEHDIEVVAEAENASEASRIISLHRPEVVIADAHIFECEADQAERLILEVSQNSRVLFVTAHEGNATSSTKNDGKSYAVRQTSSVELVEMVREAAALDPAGTPVVVGSKEWRVHTLVPGRRLLTAREREVVKLLAEGRTVRSAAEMLGLSVKTVDAHKFNLMRKLGIHNKAELVMWAIQKRVVKVPARL